MKLPDFEVTESNGKLRYVSSYLKGVDRLVFVFFRGSWCSSCNLQLMSLAEHYKKFQRLHAEILAVSVDDVKTSKAFKKKIEAPFPLASDAGGKVMRVLGIKDKLPLTGLLHAKTKYAKPSVFILDKNLNVLYQHIGKTFFDRPKAEFLLEKLKEFTQQ